MIVFVRLVEADDKAETLRNAADSYRRGTEEGATTFEVSPEEIRKIPGAPLAYWITDDVRNCFTVHRSLGELANVASTNPLNDDFQFGRVWWEPDAWTIGETWVPWAKGGRASKFYYDIETVIRWCKSRQTFGSYLGTKNRPTARPANLQHFFRPGLTWPRRTSSGLSVRIMPRGAVFGDKGPAIFPLDGDQAGCLVLLAILDSQPFSGLLDLHRSANSLEVGALQRNPFPNATASAGSLQELARDAWMKRWRLDRVVQTSHAFTVPALLEGRGSTLSERLSSWTNLAAETDLQLERIQSEIDAIAFDLYGIRGDDRRRMEEGIGAPPSSDDGLEPVDEVDDEAEGADPEILTAALLDWVLGAALGRFDIRLATGQRQPPPDPDPFDPLPVCSPGMLQDDSGLPAREAPPGYSLDLPPHGILVDDPGHPWDAVARMEAVLGLVAGDRAHAWMLEIEEILGLELRDWLRRFGFERHLKRYSRSRRKAPLFWHLAPKSREYGLWLYSPVATRDTMYRILNDYLDPKLRSAERRLVELRQEAGASPTSQQRRELAGQESLVGELRAFRGEVARVAPLWAPFRDDGVVLNCAVLHRLFDHHRTWQKECEAKWKELAKGKYDWAGWAMHLWPERVVKSCASDRSIAIAHGVEEDLWEEDDQGKWRPRKDVRAQVARLTEERTSPALQAALDAFNRAG